MSGSTKMPRQIRCCVCGSHANDNENSLRISLHRFPRDDAVKQQWAEFARVEAQVEHITDWTRLCSQHFTPDCFRTQIVRTGKRRKLCSEATPTVRLTSAKPSRQNAVGIRSEGGSVSSLRRSTRLSNDLRKPKNWRYCCVCGSVLIDGEELSFYRFPRVDVERKKEWLRSLGLTENTWKAWYRVCSRHFIDGNPECIPVQDVVYTPRPLDVQNKTSTKIGQNSESQEKRDSRISRVCWVCGVVDSERHLFRFPPAPEASSKWLESLKMEKSELDDSNRLCDLHFEQDDVIVALIGDSTVPRWALRRGAVPRMNPGQSGGAFRITCESDEAAAGKEPSAGARAFRDARPKSVALCVSLPDASHATRKTEVRLEGSSVTPAKLMKLPAVAPALTLNSEVPHVPSYPLKKLEPSFSVASDLETRCIEVNEPQSVYGSNCPPVSELNKIRFNSSIRRFVNDFGGDSFEDSSIPPIPDIAVLAGTKRDASVQTDATHLPLETDGHKPTKTIRKAMEKLDELSCIDIGNEVEVPTHIINRMLSKNLPKEKSDSSSAENTGFEVFEKALMGVFNSCSIEGDNAFAALSDRSAIPEEITIGSDHQYGTDNTINVVKSAAQFCEFNNRKIHHLEQLVQRHEKDYTELEDTIVQNLSAVMCVTGVEFIRKCFDRVLRDALSRNKDNLEKQDTVHSDVAKGSTAHQPRSYSAESKQMSKAILAYSEKGFQLLKEIADLPPPSTVRDWLIHPDGSPGFSEKALKLWGKLDGWKGGRKMCVLCVVDVPLRSDVSWDGKRLFGHEDLGFGSVDNDSVREASKAVVFFVRMLTEDKTLPVGYCLTDDLTPQVRANQIMQYISHLDSVGLRCVALVCEYSRVTYETFVELGAVTGEPDSGSFRHPNAAAKVTCFTDIHQNIKALCNLWAEKKIFRPSPEAKSAIDWDDVTRGETFLESPSLYSSLPAVSKLLSDLKLLKYQVLKDPLNANKYNAVMLTVLSNTGVKTFDSTSETIKYLEKLTAVADIFSSRHPCDIANRRPLSGANSARTQTMLTSLALYFASLCFGSGVKIRTTERKMPVVMLKMNLLNLKDLFRHNLRGRRCNTTFYTERLNLVDINASIAQICGGATRLVTATEFRAGFNKLLDDHSWIPADRLRCHHDNKSLDKADSWGFNNTFVYAYTPLESVSENASEFLADSVIETWLEKVKCMDCFQLVQKGILTFHDYNLEGNVVRDIHKMIRTAETRLAECGNIPCDLPDVWLHKFTNGTMNSLTSVNGFKSCSHLFLSARFGETSHFTVLIKDLLKIYLKLRVALLSREERINIRAPREHNFKFIHGRART